MSWIEIKPVLSPNYVIFVQLDEINECLTQAKKTF